MRKQAGKGRATRAEETAVAPIRKRQPRDPVTGQYLRCGGGEIGDASTHGLRGRVPPEYLVLQEQFLAGALVDEGEKAADIPTRRRSQLQYRAVVHRKILMLDAALQERGLFHRDKLRVAWLQRLEGLIGLALSIDRALGFERRARHVGAVDDPAEYLAEQEATCERR